MAITLHEGDCLHVLRTLADNSMDSVVTDPPYGLSREPDIAEVLRHWLAGDDYTHSASGFMGKDWDSFVPGPSIWREVLRVLKPGGHILCFAGTRTQDLMGIALRMAGFEIRDCIRYEQGQEAWPGWVYGTGFPKSLDVSKALDKGSVPSQAVERFRTALAQARIAKGLTRAEVSHAVVGSPSGACWNWESGLRVPTGGNWRALVGLLDLPAEFESMRNEAEREIVGRKKVGVKDGAAGGSHAYGMKAREVDITVPTTNFAKQWKGWGTALKPAWEPVIVGRKPVEGTVAQNVMQHGTGAMNIDACRVPGTPAPTRFDPSRHSHEGYRMTATGADCAERASSLGRWPANFITSYPEDEYSFRVDVTDEQKREVYRWLYENA